MTRKKPPRGLIPKISPKIPDTPGKFIIQWEGIQQDTGLHLIETLREYWIDRANKLSKELDPIKNKARLETSPAQWTKIQDIIRQYIQRNHTRPEEKEEFSENRSRPTSTTTQKTKHREGSRGPSPTTSSSEVDIG